MQEVWSFTFASGSTESYSGVSLQLCVDSLCMSQVSLHRFTFQPPPLCPPIPPFLCSDVVCLRHGFNPRPQTFSLCPSSSQFEAGMGEAGPGICAWKQGFYILNCGETEVGQVDKKQKAESVGCCRVQNVWVCWSSLLLPWRARPQGGNRGVLKQPEANTASINKELAYHGTQRQWESQLILANPGLEGCLNTKMYFTGSYVLVACGLLWCLAHMPQVLLENECISESLPIRQRDGHIRGVDHIEFGLPRSYSCLSQLFNFYGPQFSFLYNTIYCRE